MSAQLSNPFSATVSEKRGVSMTEYLIEGDLGSVFKEITQIFQRYSAVAYGTRVHHIDIVYPHEDKFSARMSRSNSAD